MTDPLELAESEGITPALAADWLADEAMQEPHPIWGHRGKQINAMIARPLAGLVFEWGLR